MITADTCATCGNSEGTHEAIRCRAIFIPRDRSIRQPIPVLPPLHGVPCRGQTEMERAILRFDPFQHLWNRTSKWIVAGKLDSETVALTLAAIGGAL